MLAKVFQKRKPLLANVEQRRLVKCMNNENLIENREKIFKY